MVKTSLMVLAIFLICLPALGATTGDPIDGNDGDITVGTDSLSEFWCDDFIRWPACVPCLSKCIFAFAVDAAMEEWDW